MCILNENGILFQDKIGVLTPDLERLVVVLHEQGCFYNTFSYHQTVVRRKNKLKVQVAIARKMLAE